MIFSAQTWQHKWPQPNAVSFGNSMQMMHVKASSSNAGAGGDGGRGGAEACGAVGGGLSYDVDGTATPYIVDVDAAGCAPVDDDGAMKREASGMPLTF